MLQASLLLVLAPLVGVALSPLLVLEVLGLLFLLAFVLSSFGVAIASRMRTMEGFQVVMNFVLLPLLSAWNLLVPARAKGPNGDP